MQNYYVKYIEYKNRYSKSKIYAGGTKKYYYHGTSQRIGTTLKPMPHPIVENEEVVFATNKKWLALVFIAHAGDAHIQLGYQQGIPYILEQYKGAFDKFLKGKTGYLHYVDPKGFRKDERLGMYNHEFITNKPVNIIKTEKIEDIYEELKKTEVNVITHDIKKIIEDELSPEAILWEDVIPLIRLYYGHPKNAIVLEVGTGPTGKYANAIANDIKQVIATDKFPQIIEKARNNTEIKYANKIEYQAADGNNLPFDNDTMDVILYSSSLHLLNMNKALKEARRVLKQEGIVIILEPNKIFMDPILRKGKIGFIQEAYDKKQKELESTRKFIEKQTIFEVIYKKESDRLNTFVLK